MKNICFISFSVYGYFADEAPAGGGAQRQLSLIGRTLSSEFNVSYVVGNYDQPKYEIRDSIEFYRAYRPNPSSQSYERVVKFWKLRRAMAHAGADVYVYRGYPLKAAFVYLLSKSLGKPFIYNLANDSNVDKQPAALPKPLQWLFSRMLTDADAIIAQTPYQAQRLEKEYGVHAAIVPNGYPPTDNFIPHDERNYLLWVGRLDKDQKRPHYFLDLAKRIRSEKFLLIGPSGQNKSYNEQIRRRAEELDNVVNKGAVEPNDIHEYYRDAIALINTSAYEGFPNTFLESWRYNTPVLSLSVNPNRFINPDIGGYAEDNFEALVSLSKAVADNVEPRRSLGGPAGEFVRDELAIKTVANRYANVLQDVLNAS